MLTEVPAISVVAVPQSARMAHFSPCALSLQKTLFAAEQLLEGESQS